MNGDPNAEWAKATQELAKTARTGLEIADKSRTFLWNVLGKHIELASETFLSEPLRYLAAKRHLRLIDRYNELISARHLEGKTRPVPLKIALPVFEHASLETDDALQDLWANLLATAGDPNHASDIRVGFVDIIKQLEPVDAKILSILYRELLSICSRYQKENASGGDGHFASPTDFPVERTVVFQQVPISDVEYEESVENLMRVGCVRSYIITDEITGAVNGVPAVGTASAIFRYDHLCVTALGVSFVEACVDPNLGSFAGLNLSKPQVSFFRPISEEKTGHR
jgi:hypothetical protein